MEVNKMRIKLLCLAVVASAVGLLLRAICG